MSARIRTAAIAALSTLGLPLVHGPAAASPGLTERVNLSSAEVEANGQKFPPFKPAVSADGRFVAFDSDATNLVAGDTNGCSDVFVRDRQAGTTERVSVNSDENQAIGCQTSDGGGGSRGPAISADGRFVAFASDASNLVAGDTNGFVDVFVRDRQAGTTHLISKNGAGAPAAANVRQAPSISADGRFVAFVTLAGLHSSDSNQFDDVYVHDRVANTTEIVSVDSSENPPPPFDRESGVPAISADGRYVAFVSGAALAGPDNVFWNVFVRDRQAGTTEMVSVSSSEVQANGDSYQVAGPSISADGRYVAFESDADNLVPGDTNGRFDVFVRDRQAGTTERVSLTSAGGQLQSTFKGAYEPSISAHGSRVAFASDATNLVPSDTNDEADVFVRDRAGGTTTRENVKSDGTQVGSFSLRSGFPAISPNGRFVAFLSFAHDLVPDDDNGVDDVFIHQLAGGTAPPSAPVDFDGDGDSDISVFRPGTGVWYTGGSSPSSVVFGQDGDIPVPGDYDGDGNTDQAVFRPATGVWYLNGTPPAAVPFGQNGDVPVPADYNGDGKTDVAVFRPGNNVWYIAQPASSVVFGQSGDIPVPGDYDGDGKEEVAVYRPSSGVWYTAGTRPSSAVFGQNGDVPVPGDYDGDGNTDQAVFRPSTGIWYLNGSPAASLPFGQNGDVPAPADYNGDGRTDVAVVRPGTNVWYVADPASSVVFGQNGDVPLALPHAIQRTLAAASGNSEASAGSVP